MAKLNLLAISWLLVLLASSCSSVVANDDCNNIQLQVLGAGGPEIDDGMASASFLIWINGKARVMIDAGGGSSLNFEKSSANFNHLQALLLTHLHVDHSAALPVYVKAGYFTNRENNLPIFGPAAGGNFPSTEDFVAALFSDQQKSAYPYLSDNLRQQPSTDFLVQAKSVSSGDEVWTKALSDKLSIAAIDVKHGDIPALAWRINYGSCSVTFSGDMNGTSGHLQKLAMESQLLVANNAIPEIAHPVAKRLHMTPSKIGEIAAQAKVGQLLLSHFMLRTIDVIDNSKQQIKKYYAGEILISADLSKFTPE